MMADTVFTPSSHCPPAPTAPRAPSSPAPARKCASPWWQRLACLLPVLVLAACGGGETPETPLAPPVVTAIDAEPLVFNQTARFTVRGSGLDRTELQFNGCDGVTLLPGSSGTERRVSCIPRVTGTMTVQAVDQVGTVLLPASFTVPAPQVTIDIRLGGTAGAEDSLGALVVELDPVAAPLTVANFLRYVEEGFYDHTVLHRVIVRFVAQGGWLEPGGQEKPGRRDPIPLESRNGLSNLRGTLGMARTAVPNSATSQFYFNLIDNPELDFRSNAEPGYAVFGRVVQGIELLDRIGSVQVSERFGSIHYPVTEIIIRSIAQTR